jgi:glycerol-3-phosphate dehydrogenase
MSDVPRAKLPRGNPGGGMPESSVDLAIVGGGINGCGIARDAAGRGLSVFLCEQGDLASGTSSASTKLIHGGLRYLEFYEFRLVHEALAEREVLLRAAPHIIWPLRFILPHHRGLRPWPVIRLGLFFYDHVGGRRLLPPTRSIELARDPAGKGLKPEYRRAFEYSDCRVDDARLVVLNARDAADRGAIVKTRTKCVAARREGSQWRITLEDQNTRLRSEVVSRALINAGGPWVSDVIAEVAGRNASAPVRLVKGSHIVVDRLFDHDRAYTFQNSDGRVCFAIPYERDFTLIGTTDEDYHGEPGNAAISEGEIDYLLTSVGAYLTRPVDRQAIRRTYAGVRPLFDDGASKAQEATRDYVLTLDSATGSAPMLSVIGGKITTFRRLAEQALAKLAPTFSHMRPPWTREAVLPGGDIPVDAYDAWAAEVAQQRFPFLDPALVARLCRAYGSRIATVLDGVGKPDDLGRSFGAGLSEREVAYLADQEWAETADDILWRRSKLGLRVTAEERALLERHLLDRGHLAMPVTAV